MSAKPDGKCSDWKAWHDLQPPGPATLYVTGKCTFPTSGFSVELKPHTPPGINPSILVLDKIVRKPTGVVNDVITTIDVRYEEKTKVHYSEVEIMPDNTSVPVKEVQ